MKRIIAFCVATVLICSLIVPMRANAAVTYNVSAALEYARNHWNDGVGLCAEFVSKCVQAGGINIPTIRTTTECANAICSATGLQRQRLKLNSSGYATKALNEGCLGAGDVVLQFCDTHNVGPHILFCAGFDSEGYALFYAHNNALNCGRYRLSVNTSYQHTTNCNMGAQVVHLSGISSELPPKWSGWMSSSKMGSEATSFTQGNTYYLCYKIYGATSGTLFDQIGKYTYSVTETIYYPDGSVANTYKYNNDNNWIGIKCTVAGRYTYRIVLDGDYTGELTGSFTVRPNVPTITPNTSNVSLDLSGTKTKLITLTTGGYLPDTLSVGCNKDSRAFTATFDSFSGNTVKMTVKGVSIGSGTITVNLKNSATSEILASCKINVSVTGPSYTVSYDANGGSGAPSSQTKVYGQDLTLSETTPKGKGYTVSFNGNGGTPSVQKVNVYQTFNSWNTSRTGSGTSYPSGSIYSNNQSLTLYAQYHGAHIDQAPTVLRTGYNFIGWYDSTSTDEYGMPLGMQYTGAAEIKADTTFYAIWSKSPLFLWGDFNYDGVIDKNDIDGIARVFVELDAYPDDDTLFRVDMNADGKVTDTDLLLVAQIEAGLVSQESLPAYQMFSGISVVGNPQTSYEYGEPLNSDGIKIKVTYSNGTMYTLSKGFTLSGYDPYLIGSQSVKVNFYQFTTKYAVTVNAPSYVLSFDANEGVVSPSFKTVTYNSVIGTLPTPTRTGYTFLGWTFEKSSTSYISASTKYTHFGNKTVYAQWKAGCESGRHNYSSTVIEPTCTQNGYTEHVCLYCGNRYQDASTSPVGHQHSYFVEKEPTETSAGQITGICTVCGQTTSVTIPKFNLTDYSYAVLRTATCVLEGSARYTWKSTAYGTFSFNVIISKTEHVFRSVVTEPTCTTQGYTTHTCSGCGDSYQDTYTAALGHSYAYKVTTTPTTSAAGVLTGTCSRCTSTTTVTLPKLNTTDYTYAVTKAATCTATGTGRYTWKTTTYGSFYFDVTIAKTAHNYKDTVTAPTCTEKGYTTHTCSVCGDSYKDTYTDALGHDWDDGVVTTKPTETTEGVKTFTCSRCGTTKTESVPVLDHTHTYTSTVTAPTCTAQGYTTYTCSCGDSYVTDYVAALGHDWDDGIVTTQPTETTEGVKTFTCSRCGATRTESVPALGHTHSYTATVTPPTCTEKGYTTYTCTVCGDSYVADYVDALGHDFVDGICSRCGAEDPDAKDPCEGYTDINRNSWYHDAADFVISRGLMGSTKTNALTFEPNTPCTRSMIVMILYNIAGTPDVSYVAKFPDVKDGQWYTKAVMWAYQNGIVSGYDNGKFGPNDKVTREQMAVVLKGYADFIGKDTSKTADLSKFPDGNKATWSKSYISWAVAEGLINGKAQNGQTYLDPQGVATRAEVAALIRSFVLNILEAK